MMPNINKTLMIKRIMLTLFTAAFLLGYSICNADSPDSRNLRGGSQTMSAPQDSSESYFLLETGFLGPERPDAGNTIWNGDRATTSKKCPANYTPLVALAFISSSEGEGGFYGNVVLSADFSTTTYRLSNIRAYTNQDIRNGKVKFRWQVFCKVSPPTTTPPPLALIPQPDAPTPITKPPASGGVPKQKSLQGN